ncbi:hypothetical protein EM932_06025 [Flavivirga rizhaonensis]|uniref:Uncharacterized protein n=1 Tax=Flavivirga rizhaonensis TaxID=2559571 RepID=A0A4S1DZY8_9FLAO|nr:hypothetical protein EM932_06025 [Flavivirga rizhaonensis]
MIIVNYSIAFKALDHHIKQHNEANDLLSCRIRQAIASTARDIIKIYGLSLIKANNIKALDVDNLPPLKTNNVQLARMANASTRTIQRHLKRLQDANIITHKVWHGSNSGYELWLNPTILLAKCGKAVDTPKEESSPEKIEVIEKQYFKEKHSTTCLHTDSSNTGYINNLLIGVDKLKNVTLPPTSGNKNIRSSLPLTSFLESRNVTGNNFTGYTGKKSAQKIEDAGEKVRIKRVTNQTKGAELSKIDKIRSASLSVYVNSLWKLARNTLYADTHLTEKQKEIAEKLILQWYLPVADKNLSKVHQIYVERIALVKKFIDKDPENRYVQLPNRYFDPKNTAGFTGTRIWWNKHKKRQEEIKMKLILHAQIKRFLNNEKKDTSKQKPRLEFFRECENRIGKLGKPLLLKEFHASIMSPSTQHYLYTNT